METNKQENWQSHYKTNFIKLEQNQVIKSLIRKKGHSKDPFHQKKYKNLTH